MPLGGSLANWGGLKFPGGGHKAHPKPLKVPLGGGEITAVPLGGLCAAHTAPTTSNRAPEWLWGARNSSPHPPQNAKGGS